LVDVDSKTGIAKVALKEENGMTIRVEINQNIACIRTFGKRIISGLISNYYSTSHSIYINTLK
jgi:hypothetical protein